MHTSISDLQVGANGTQILCQSHSETLDLNSILAEYEALEEFFAEVRSAAAGDGAKALYLLKQSAEQFRLRRGEISSIYRKWLDRRVKQEHKQRRRDRQITWLMDQIAEHADREDFAELTQGYRDEMKRLLDEESSDSGG